jgi:hypothetical protein
MTTFVINYELPIPEQWFVAAFARMRVCQTRILANAATKQVLGYVRVTELTPTTAKVASCEHNNKAAVPIAQLPDQAVCELVSRDFSDMRIRYAVAIPDPDQARLVATAVKVKQLPNSLQFLELASS